MLLSSSVTLPCGAIIKNRIAKAAMSEGLADHRDLPTASLAALYQRWSLGGAGLLITGNAMIDHRYLERAGNVVLEDRAGLPAFRAWSAAAVAGGGHVWLQLSHPGRQCPMLITMHPVSASDVQLRLAGVFGKPTPLKAEGISEIVARFVHAASLAKEAGFTGVQIHSAHGYLNSQFLSPLTNTRKDEWGGSLENRAHFLLAQVRAVRDAVGPTFPLSVKLNVSDFQKNGLELQDSLVLASWLGQAGVDLIELSGGSYEHLAFFHGATRSQQEDPSAGYFSAYVKDFVQAAKTPVMVTGGFRSVEAIRAAVEQGGASLVGLARPFCLEPEFPRKILGGEPAEIPRPPAKLNLPRGFFGPQSRSGLMRLLSNQALAGWYYWQIRRLAGGKSPSAAAGLLWALLWHMSIDLKRSLQRRLFGRRYEPLTLPAYAPHLAIASMDGISPAGATQDSS